jgi:hypothetical protein
MNIPLFCKDHAENGRQVYKNNGEQGLKRPNTKGASSRKSIAVPKISKLISSNLIKKPVK